ncbi:unnamed protein product [Arctogadus glacialis]
MCGGLGCGDSNLSSESGEFPSDQPPTSNPSGQELAYLFGEVVGRATKALNIVLPKKPTAKAYRFKAEAEESLRFIFGGPACLNIDSQAMESLLGKVHRSTAMQARQANTAAILTLYTHHLAGLMQNQPVDASLAREFQSATMCLASVSKEQGVPSGRSLAQLWVVRQHLWLSQSKLQPADRDCLLRVPVEPTSMFGPQAPSLLQQARDRRRCAEEVSESGEAGKAPRSACTSGGFSRLGLGLNIKKSKLKPNRVTYFLGMVVDSRRATVTFSPVIQQSRAACLSSFTLRAQRDWRVCLRLMGLKAAMIQTLALLHMRPVQRCLLSVGLCPQSPARAKVTVSQ